MNRSLLERVPLPALAIAGATAWTIGGMLFATQADTDPVGAHYDAYNRIYTAAIALLLGGALAVRARLVRAGLSHGRRAISALAVGFGLVLAGNLLEFWGALIAGVQSSAAAEASGGEGFWGSDPGFAAVLLGAVVVVVAAVALARAAGSWPRVTMRARVAIGAAGLLWGLSLNPPVAPAVAAVPALLFGFAWLTLALTCERLQEQPVPSTPRGRNVAQVG